jgi:hypothetical protein
MPDYYMVNPKARKLALECNRVRYSLLLNTGYRRIERGQYEVLWTALDEGLAAFDACWRELFPEAAHDDHRD